MTLLRAFQLLGAASARDVTDYSTVTHFRSGCRKSTWRHRLAVASAAATSPPAVGLNRFHVGITRQHLPPPTAVRAKPETGYRLARLWTCRHEGRPRRWQSAVEFRRNDENDFDRWSTASRSAAESRSSRLVPCIAVLVSLAIVLNSFCWQYSIPELPELLSNSITHLITIKIFLS